MLYLLYDKFVGIDNMKLAEPQGMRTGDDAVLGRMR